MLGQMMGVFLEGRIPTGAAPRRARGPSRVRLPPRADRGHRRPALLRGGRRGGDRRAALVLRQLRALRLRQRERLPVDHEDLRRAQQGPRWLRLDDPLPGALGVRGARRAGA